MKTILWFVIVVLVSVNVKASWEISQTENREKLLQIRCNVLQDQLTDMTWQVSQRPSYADGVRAGFEGSKDARYREGYHAAITQTLEQAKMSEALSKSESNE